MNEEKKYIFEKLTPVSDIDISTYESAIDYVFREDDIKNVAISGAYGAGKSSVLASYKKAHCEIKFVHISLAHFQHPDDKKNAKGNEASIKESVLEGKILNQLIHQIPSDKIPQTNFRVKKTINKSNLWWSAATLILLFISFLTILFFDKWKLFVGILPEGFIHTILNCTTTAFAPIVSGIICLALICVLVFQLVKAQKNKNIFRKLSIQGNEIEIFEESDDSYFDKYLNEVLYLFENVDGDVIVFEDMDRFDANIIFERLREVNTLANLQRKKDNKKILRFFYLLRDDIFISKDRTKFFDCIIPVVPVVDSSNSYNQIITHLEKNGLYQKFDGGFLQGLSLYVDEMRLLKNICNEFLIYYNRLNTTELNYNKMLALITYKNLFPRDFSDLQLNRGFVYALFSNKEKFIESETAKLKSKILNLQQTIQRVRDEHLNDVKELDDMYNYRLLATERMPYPSRQREVNQLNEWYQNEYPKRVNAIQNKRDGKLLDFEAELSNTERELELLESRNLCNIIKRENINSIFSITSKNEIGTEELYNEIKSSEYFDLLKYLIRNGYIDETYADYMTYFYEGSLSRIDKTFLRSVTDKNAKPYSYELKYPQMVFERLRPFDFDQEETLNFALCDYILKEQPESEHLTHLIAQLRSTKNYSFVEQFFINSSEIPVFIRAFNNNWTSLFADVHDAGQFKAEHLKDYSVLTLYYSDKECINAINSQRKLTEYITSSADYLNIEAPKIDKLIDGFKLLNISFPEIDYVHSNKDLFMAVYENNLYVLNFDNVALILSKVLGIENCEDIRHKNYSLILINSESALFKRIEQSMPKYMDIVLQECNGQIFDHEHVAIIILNRDDIECTKKQEYIRFLKTSIKEITSIKDHSVWESLVRSDVLIYSESNIMNYFCHVAKIDAALIDFINKSKQQLDFSIENVGYDSKTQREALFNAVIICNELTNTHYTQMLTTLGFTFNSFDLQGISDEKMQIIINNNIIKMEPSTLNHLRREYPNVLLHFVRKHIEKYVDIMTTELFLQSELIDVLTWDIPDSFKIKLMGFSGSPISIINKNYSLPLCIHILQNNLMQDDMFKLYLSFEREPSDIQTIVSDKAKENIKQIIDSPHIASTLLKEFLLASDDVQIEDKIGLVVAMIPTLEQSEVCKYLMDLDLNEYIKIFDSHAKPKFNITDQNVNLLNAFKEKGWIYEYLEDTDRPGYYKIRRREPKTK